MVNIKLWKLPFGKTLPKINYYYWTTEEGKLTDGKINHSNIFNIKIREDD